MNQSLVEKTKKVISSISTMEAVKPYFLVGGTALAIQLEHRLSEDLDFMRWQKTKGENMEVDIRAIEKELLQKNHTIKSKDIFEFNHVEFYIDDGVKLSFYAPEKRAPIIKTTPYINNINLLDIDTIAVLKMETMLRRSNFRDYYDLYFILKDKKSDEIATIIDNALKYSGHSLKSKNLLGKLINSEQFKPDSEFKQLNAKSDITAKEIAQFMNEKVKTAYQTKSKSE